MNTRVLLKLSLIISVLGIILLYILAVTIEPRLVKISEININLLDQGVKIQGQILDIRTINTTQEDYSIIRIKDSSGSIDVTFNKKISFNELDEIEVIGKVSEYKQELQIDAQKIRIM